MKNNGNFIKKHHKDRNFTILDNNIFKNKDISLKAKGLLSMLLSLPDNWQFSERGLTALSADGRDSLRSGLDELEEHGYLKRTMVRNDNGQFSKTVYNVYETPTTVEPRSEKPTMDNPTVYKELSNKGLINKELSNKDIVDSKESTKVNKYDKVPYFNEFWKAYPKKRSKGQALAPFKRQVKDRETLDLILADIEFKLNNGVWHDFQFIPHASSYLNAEQWLDENIVPKPKYKTREVINKRNRVSTFDSFKPKD